MVHFPNADWYTFRVPRTLNVEEVQKGSEMLSEDGWLICMSIHLGPKNELIRIQKDFICRSDDEFFKVMRLAYESSRFK